MQRKGSRAGPGVGCGEEATVKSSLICFWHKLFISSALYRTRMMFPYPMPLGAVLNNCPLASGLSEGISSGASISQFVLCNLRRIISIKSERRRKKKAGEKKMHGKWQPLLFSGSLVVSEALPRS